MNIGLVIYGSLETLSGGYFYDRKLVGFLRSQGDTVDILSLPWRNYAAHLTDNLHVRLPGRDAMVSRAVDSKFDILIQDELNHPSLLVANRGKHSYPVISLVHHLRCSELRPVWQNAFYRAVERKYLLSVDGFILNSRTTEKVVQSLVGSSKPSLIAYPPTDRFGEPVSEKEIRERAKSSEFHILFLGNVIYRKGLHTLLQAIKSLKSNIQVDIVGSLDSEPRYAKQMQEFITQNNLSSLISFHGSLNKQPLIDLLKRAHILVVPSSYEGFGIVYLEGMCFGLPAVGTTAGAASEVIHEGVDGFLIEPGDADGLASRLKVLEEDRELLIQMSLAARRRYLRQPKWEETAGQIREFLLKQIRAFSV